MLRRALTLALMALVGLVAVSARRINRARRQACAMALGSPREFAGLTLNADHVVSTSPCGLAVAYGGLRPVLPGHTIVAPTRRVERFAQLQDDELQAIVRLALSVQRQVGSHLNATAFNLALKDGKGAGQPVPHIHLHVVPRTAGDLAVNDEVYGRIDRWSPAGEPNVVPPMVLPPDEARAPRSEAEMAAEAARYVYVRGERGPPLPAPVLFGRFELAPTQVFYRSEAGLSLAVVNLKPLSPGHVLVIPRRVVATLAQLNPDELADLWRSAREVHALVCGVHGAGAALFGVQDGRGAGQSVPHAHIHIIPR